MNIEELKRLAEVNYGWRNADSAWLHQSNDGSAVVGNIDDEHDPHVKNPVAVVDVTIYDGFEGDSLQLAQFYAAANPAAILKLIRQRNELLAALREIAEWTERYTTPGHPISTVARAAIAKAEKQK